MVSIPAGLPIQAPADEIFGLFKFALSASQHRFAQGLFQLPGKKGFRLFRLLAQIPDASCDILKPFPLTGQRTVGILPTALLFLTGICRQSFWASSSGLGLAAFFRKLFPDFFLTLGEIARFASEFAHFLAELAARLFFEFVPEFLEALSGAFAAGERGIGLLPVQCSGSLLGVCPGLVELLTGFLHLGGLTGGIHLLAQLIEVCEELLFLLTQSFKTAPDLFAFGLILGELEGGLQFLQLAVDVILALGEFLEPVQNGELFPARLGLRGFLLFLVPVRLGFHLEFVHLAAGRILLAVFSGLAPAPAHAVLVGNQLEQCRMGVTFSANRVLKGGGVVFCEAQFFKGTLHFLSGIRRQFFGFCILDGRLQFPGFTEHRSLCVANHGFILSVLGTGPGLDRQGVRCAFQIPGRIQNFPLGIDEFPDLVALGFALARI